MSATAAPDRQRRLLHVGVALLCGLLGFLLVAQVRATEELGERLEAEREEDLARILADLSDEADRLQSEITELRLLLIEFEGSQEAEQLALRTLQRRLDDLRILAGIAAAEGEGLVMTIEDPAGHVGQELLVDVVQELRDAGAEAIAINGTRLVVSSAFTTRNERLLLEGSVITPPYRVQAIGSGETMDKAMGIPGGAVSTLESRAGVRVTVEVLAHLSVPARTEIQPFVYGEPVPVEETG
jgi:uncharacterized protein YlxW (UPF0749 family)